MKPEQILQSLKELALKLNITVSEKSFKNIGIRVRSGLCKVNEENRIILDKHLSVHRKNRVLAAFLSDLPCEDIYIVPAVREYIEKINPKSRIFSRKSEETKAEKSESKQEGSA